VLTVHTDEADFNSLDLRTTYLSNYLEFDEEPKGVYYSFCLPDPNNPAEAPYPLIDELHKSVAKSTDEYRKRGFYPLHRHPDFVQYIDALVSLYVLELTKCLLWVDVKTAALGRATIPNHFLGHPNISTVERDYDYHFVVPEAAINSGLCWVGGNWMSSKKVYSFIRCKGKSHP
jgi:hypothetical protein